MSPITAEDLADRSPFSTAKIKIVMPAVNALRDEIADYRTNQHIGRKMLLGFQPRNIHERCQAIGHDLREGARVLMCDDSRYRPCRCSMLRRKRNAALEKLAITAALIGTLSSERVLHSLHYHKAVQGRFPGKKPCLAPVFLVLGMAKQPHPACTAYKCGNGRIGKIVVSADCLGIVREAS